MEDHSPHSCGDSKHQGCTEYRSCCDGQGRIQCEQRVLVDGRFVQSQDEGQGEEQEERGKRAARRAKQEVATKDGHAWNANWHRPYSHG